MSIKVRPKILVLTSTFPRWVGDSEPRFVLDLCKTLSDKAHVIVLAPHCSGAKLKENLEGVEVNRFRYAPSCLEQLAYNGGMLSRIRANYLRVFLLPLFFLGMVFASARLLKSHRFTVIHAHWLIPQGFTAAVSRYVAGVSVPLIVTCHGADLYTLEKKPWSWLKRWALEKTDGVTVVSSSMKNKICNSYNVCNKQIDVVPMGVDLRYLFAPDERYFQHKRDLLFVGRLVEKKGVSYLIAALHRLLHSGIETSLTIVGDGPLRETLEKQVRLLGIADYVTFVGSVPQSKIPDFYRRHRAAVFPFVVAEDGDQEGLGLVVIEAQGCGCPVIASDLPALEDSFPPELRDWLVTPSDVDALADKIEMLLSMNSLDVKRLVRTARAYALNRFDKNIVKDKFLKILKIEF